MASSWANIKVDFMSKLQPGVRAEVSVASGMYKGRYNTEIMEIKEDSIKMLHPLLRDGMLPFYRDMVFTLTVEDGGALYVYEMAVLRTGSKGGPNLTAEIISEPQRIQRRSFLRIACSWEMSVFQIEKELASPMKVDWIAAKALDISLRGMRFRVDDSDAGDLTFDSGDRLMLSFELFGKKYYMSGSATRIVHEQKAWAVGVSFDSVAISVEKKLFEYIRQQEMLGREDQ